MPTEAGFNPATQDRPWICYCSSKCGRKRSKRMPIVCRWPWKLDLCLNCAWKGCALLLSSFFPPAPLVLTVVVQTLHQISTQKGSLGDLLGEVDIAAESMSCMSVWGAFSRATKSFLYAYALLRIQESGSISRSHGFSRLSQKFLARNLCSER